MAEPEWLKRDTTLLELPIARLRLNICQLSRGLTVAVARPITKLLEIRSLNILAKRTGKHGEAEEVPRPLRRQKRMLCKKGPI